MSASLSCQHWFCCLLRWRSERCVLRLFRLHIFGHVRLKLRKNLTFVHQGRRWLLLLRTELGIVWLRVVVWREHRWIGRRLLLFLNGSRSIWILAHTTRLAVIYDTFRRASYDLGICVFITFALISERAWCDVTLWLMLKRICHNFVVLALELGIFTNLGTRKETGSFLPTFGAKPISICWYHFLNGNFKSFIISCHEIAWILDVWDAFRPICRATKLLVWLGCLWAHLLLLLLKRARLGRGRQDVSL